MNKPNKVCAICGKGYRRAIKRSHSMRASIHRLQPNLQWLTLENGSRMKACTRCIKSVGKRKIQMPVPEKSN